ncbi:Heterogeneous nuclear ribonucleoprotein M [Heterocephalus glaber]|uniref:Heterogeneous nuclear ribonucleoprotein M n=1 Tax=Heterocephalus glaber TaxID=10181 RepID=G5BLC7_HETGA|nr:Heterogeneous nuclear ribonucleoprotein M [Heterocephalus glaber]
MVAGVKVAAEVATTEPKMEEESGIPSLPRSNGAPGLKEILSNALKRGKITAMQGRGGGGGSSHGIKRMMLKDKFKECGHVLHANIKMENGKCKGYGVVELPKLAERACQIMSGMKLSGRD